MPLNSNLASLAFTIFELSLISISDALMNQSSCPAAHVVIDAFCNLFLSPPSRKSNLALPLRVLLKMLFEFFKEDEKEALGITPTFSLTDSSNEEPVNLLSSLSILTFPIAYSSSDTWSYSIILALIVLPFFFRTAFPEAFSFLSKVFSRESPSIKSTPSFNCSSP